MRWDLNKGEKSKLVESAVVKTVAGFLNSRFGGTLLIGVDDGGEVLGLEVDYRTLHKEGKQDADLFQLHLGQLIENAVGLAAASNATFAVSRVDGRDVCRVHVEPSAHPVWAEVTVSDDHGQMGKGQAFFVRYNNGTRVIADEAEIKRYVGQRWDQAGAPGSSARSEIRLS